MLRHYITIGFVALSSVAQAATTLPYGSPPAPLSPVASEIAEAKLPPLKLDPNGPVGRVATSTQVIQRAKSLGLDLNSALNFAASAEADAARLNALAIAPIRRHVVVYSGTTLSGVAPLLASNTRVIVTSPALTIDMPLTIAVPHVTLDLGETRLKPGPAWEKTIKAGKSQPILVIHGTQDVYIDGGVIDGAEGALVENASQVAITGLTVMDAPGYGVVIADNSQGIAVENSHFSGLMASGIAVLPGTKDVLMERNVITGGVGHSNQQAGLLVTARTRFTRIGGPNFLLAPTTLPDGHIAYQFAPEAPVTSFTNPPRDVLLIDNSVTRNRTNGIYLDGAVLTYVAGNHIEGNSKEGMCLDNGSTANVVTANNILDNGQRWGQSDDYLRLDFVLKFGRMLDGTANAKLPGISIDNAAFNIILDNHVADNAGSGIKMVRTSFYNLIGRNNIADNNAGANSTFFFFGIEVGGAPGDIASSALNFTPSMGNIIYQNIIAGPHHSGIQFCSACGFNDVFDNRIIRPQVFALEQTSPNSTNIFTNNFSQAPSRNASLNGADGRVLLGGAGVYDNSSQDSQ